MNKQKESQKLGCENNKSPRINMNAKNLVNNYQVQAEKFSSRAQLRRKNSGVNNFTSHNSFYTHRDRSPNLRQSSLYFNIL